MAVLHGQADDSVPDSTAFFPYRNGHHVSVTPGFTDARGSRPTLSELHTDDPAGYAFTTWFPFRRGARAPPPPPAHGALRRGARAGVRPALPARVVGTPSARGSGRSTGPAWREPAPPTARGPSSTPGPTPRQTGSTSSSRDPVRIRLDLPAAGLDATRSLSLHLSGHARLDLALAGPFAPTLLATLDGSPVVFERTTEGALLSALVPGPSGSLLVVSPAPAGPVAETDLLVPALVRAEGANGATYSTVLTVGKLSERELLLEALLLDGLSAPFALSVPARSSGVATGDLVATGTPGRVASPLRLRVVAGDTRAVAASARVFNTTTFGSVRALVSGPPGGASVLGNGETAHLFGPADSRRERTNVSLFAPFEDSAVEVAVLDGGGLLHRSLRVDLAALHRAQLDDVLAGGEARGFSIRVTVLSGRVQVYGTAISNSSTNDPRRIPALEIADAASAWTVPAVASARDGTGRTSGATSSSSLRPGRRSTRPFSLATAARPRRSASRSVRESSASSPTSSSSSFPRRHPGPERSSSRRPPGSCPWP